MFRQEAAGFTDDSRCRRDLWLVEQNFCANALQRTRNRGTLFDWCQNIPAGGTSFFIARNFFLVLQTRLQLDR
ncbi:unnamed protein product [Gongylonema pulchrum]|uniref:SAC domain-containing protein n=1 Tax=Gongylonema pulchrum TaxID=637853 RepID=A0A183D8I5_9BILA|nr:unnamed protein product [Gongylonema pulchrum]